MSLFVKGVMTTATLALMLNHAVNSAFSLTEKIHHPISVARSQPATDTLIIPGERVGPITSKTSKQDLIKLFGVSHIVDKTISGAEGDGSYPATQLNLNHGRSLLVIWSDNTRTKPTTVRILGPAWKTREGIRLGTTLSELRQKLGDFQLYGLGWDYSGFIINSRYKNLNLQVDAAPDAVKRFPNDYKAVLGEGPFSSANPHWKPLGMRIVSIDVLL